MFVVGRFASGDVNDGDTTGDGDATAGEVVFAASCADCHGPSCEGASGPPMMDAVPHHGTSNIVGVVMSGSFGMPAVVSDGHHAADVPNDCKATEPG